MSTPRNLFLTVVLFFGTLGCWEVLVRFFEVPVYILPPPSLVAEALWRGIAEGVYVRHLAYTSFETVTGFVVGTTIGLFLGTIIAVSRYADYFLYPYIVMFQSLPKVALAPLIVLWFGLGITSKIVTAALISFFPVMVNTIVGLRSVDEDRLSLMKALDSRAYQIFWYLRVPSALPFIMAGLDVALILSLIGAIVAEFVGAQAGLGVLIQTMNANLDVSGQFSILLILAMFGLFLNRLILFVRRRILFWDSSEQNHSKPEF
jgi:NitT/TauT family transport system permease protein